ncbi:N-acetyltransferase [Frankia sp. CNm7]|uniref:N-acetyltransferase n=1 Tax=Frankia nepalensis TaxID=1836974 RepID=A0A937RA96_9ACTN|nr:GNAT family N-acetyltransferase [Frankia nepalensis]MBL7496609.1 N-acetyltransferase [Frankia nepalensis]MBL7513352.1 N-acetyltransferase [Frankia nepalensis]MBL7521611.1 N-acetyltransferase [Frankia nepalensis]MBL7626617.1 N-acetyltransferase [Frankia nepalensis]
MAGKRTVTDVPERRRFELEIDGTIAGFVTYSTYPGIIAFNHTETDPAFAGQGVGGDLAREALDAARARNLTVWPRCPFIRSWIERHPDYADLVDPNWSPEHEPAHGHHHS